MLALLLIFAKLITVFHLEMNDVMKTKSVGETINNEAKEQNRGFLDEDKSIGTHWIAMYFNNNISYFDSFGVEHIPKEI